MNRLSLEKSPYLLQHATNPVDWYPWGTEAFQKSQELNRPIFLSIGYATCHWCHVMEKESFSDPTIGKMLNEAFINIKVDREEHPEVDSLYMDFAQVLLNGTTGWPLNMVLSPDLKPLIALTYLPPREKNGSLGLADFIQQFQDLWKSQDKADLLLQSSRLVELFANSSNATGHLLTNQDDLDQALRQFFKIIDPIYGGLRGRPKFPLGFHLEFLLTWSKQKKESAYIHYVHLTLESMYRGGLYDHIGGGFSRYSVEEDWVIPHFEKMLYDNAILARTYLQAWKCTKKNLYAEVTIETLSYILRDLSREEGGFFSGEDADSEGEEGLFYTWSIQEIHDVLSPQEADLFCTFYDVTRQGNFKGRSVLHMDLTLEEYAQALSMKVEEISTILNLIKKRLLLYRQQRPRPIRDEKLVVSWNGLTIDVFAQAFMAFQDTKYLEAAKKAVQFIHTHLWKDNRLLHRWCNGDSRFPAILDDYAFLIKGLLSLAEADFDPFYLKWAIELTEIVFQDFKELEGAFYQTNGQDPLLFRKCHFYDGAEPSGNGVHTENLLRLYQMTGHSNYKEQAEDILKASRDYIINSHPAAFYHMTAALRYLDHQASTIIVFTSNEEDKKILKTLFSNLFSPHLLVLWKEFSHFPIVQDKEMIKGQTTVYICQQNRCSPPLTKMEDIIASIEKVK